VTKTLAENKFEIQLIFLIITHQHHQQHTHQMATRMTTSEMLRALRLPTTTLVRDDSHYMYERWHTSF